ERNDLLRAAYWNRFATLVPDPNMLMFTDESHKDQRTHDRLYGYSEIGVPCVQRATFVHGQSCRYSSILPLLTLDGIITYDLIEGSLTSGNKTKSPAATELSGALCSSWELG
ncbi:hypothetical protein BC835DRAFT_1299641, partial [Cytidiella melzeri]